jgi:hypothetical protein
MVILLSFGLRRCDAENWSGLDELYLSIYIYPLITLYLSSYDYRVLRVDLYEGLFNIQCSSSWSCWTFISYTQRVKSITAYNSRI